jgi:hypothetical protein
MIKQPFKHLKKLANRDRCINQIGMDCMDKWREERAKVMLDKLQGEGILI